MKKILQNKREYHLLDVVKMILFFFWHIILWSIFALSMYGFNYLIYNYEPLVIFNKHKILSIHVAIVSPVISYILYIIYYEKGWLTIKAILWSYSIITIVVTIIIFFFNL